MLEFEELIDEYLAFRGSRPDCPQGSPREPEGPRTPRDSIPDARL
jgi:hypothetical protein